MGGGGIAAISWYVSACSRGTICVRDGLAARGSGTTPASGTKAKRVLPCST